MKAITALRHKGHVLRFGGTGQTFTGPTLSSLNFDGLRSWSTPERERIPNDFEAYAAEAFCGNGVLFTVLAIRLHVLSEARFQFQQLEKGRPGDLYGNEALSLLESPWPNGTTGELVARMEQDGSLAGNFFATVVKDERGQRLRRLRPDWVTIVTESPSRPDGSPGEPWDLDAQVSGYLYQPDGRASSGSVLLTPDEVVHWSPIPDPVAQWRGMSWITPILDEIEGDTAASRHKLKFFENGATSNVVVTYDSSVAQETVKAFAELFQDQHAGADNAYKTIHLGGGADAKTVGADMRQLDFKVTQGAGESRIAAASLVGAVMAQFSEGMAGSSLNAGNFTAAKRRFADVGARPLWRSMAAALSTVVDVPEGSRLWYDDRDIPFLQDDARDAAEILNVKSQAIASLTRDGFSGESAVAAVSSGDLRLLKHTGLPSVQVQQAPEVEE